MLKYSFVFSFLFFSFFASAQNSEAKNKFVVWYKPFFFTAPTSNTTTVTLFGRTNPKVSVSIDPSQVVTANTANEAPTEKTANITTVSESSGEFRVNLNLPSGFVQIPVEIVGEDSQSSTYIITLQITDKDIVISANVETDSAKIVEWRKKLQEYIESKYGLGVSMNTKMKGLWVSPALGISYQSHSQTLSGDTKLSFQGMHYPSLAVLSSYATDNWLINLSYRRTPGKSSGSSAPFTMEKTNYTWTNTLLEGGWNSQQKNYREKLRLTYLAGFQQNFMPYFRAQYGNTIELQTVQTSALSVGAQMWAQLWPKYFTEVIFRYQYPFSATSISDNNFTMTPELSFDGSAGLFYEHKPKRYYGLVVFGQFQKYYFKYTNALDASVRTGTQNLFMTNIDFRYVFQF